MRIDGLELDQLEAGGGGLAGETATMTSWIHILWLLFCLPGMVLAEEGAGLEARYRDLCQLHQNVLADKELRTFRQPWDALILEIDTLRASDPPPDMRLDARLRFLQATMAYDLYIFSGRASDLRKAGRLFALMAEAYPDSRLTDDALFRLADIRLRQNRVEGARRNLLKILAGFPDGNRSDEAQYQLARLNQPGELPKNLFGPLAARVALRAAPEDDGLGSPSASSSGTTNTVLEVGMAEVQVSLEVGSSAGTSAGPPARTSAGPPADISSAIEVDAAQGDQLRESLVQDSVSGGQAQVSGPVASAGLESALSPPASPRDVVEPLQLKSGCTACRAPPASPSDVVEPLQLKSGCTACRAPPASPRDVVEPLQLVSMRSTRMWTNPDYTRIALELSGRVRYQQLSVEGVGDETGQILLILERTHLEPAYLATLEKVAGGYLAPNVGGLVARVLFTPQSPDVLTVSIDIKRIKSHRVTQFFEPERLLIDLFGATENLDEEVDELGELVLELEDASQRPFVVVVDAGHGGDDPGASGPTGVHEKDVVLAIARKINKKLSTNPGVQVIMTRDGDNFVPLGERARIANRHNADLFISIHANASTSMALRGVESYYLDTASDEGAEKLAVRENAMLKEKTDLGFILQDLLISGNVRYSRRLARSVQDSMITSLRDQYPARSVRDLGVKAALFYVLFGAQMPSILVETAFVSNPVEELRLKDPVFQEKVAEAIAQGVQRFRAETDALSRSKE